MSNLPGARIVKLIGKQTKMRNRFRGFLPVVIDVETGGLKANTDALLEIAAVFLNVDEDGNLSRGETIGCHVTPFEGSKLVPESMAINKIDPHHPFRFAVSEADALETIFTAVKAALKEHNCERAVLVGHNAWFDLSFVVAAADRCKFKKIPFHKFSSLDTVSLCALVFGETVLAKGLRAAGIPFKADEAHSAIYDAEVTADLFCAIVNQWHSFVE